MRRRDLCATVAAAAVIFATTAGAGVIELSSFQAGDAGWHLGTLGVGQLDGDPQLEIVVPYRNSNGAWFLDAFKPSGSRLAGFPYAGNAEINTSATLGDLDGNGTEEILFTCGASVIALRGNGTVLWSNQVNRLNYIPDSGFMTVTNGFYWSGTGQLISRLPQTATFSSQVSSPIVADLSGDGSKQVVTAWKIDPDSTSGAQDFNPFINDIWASGEWGTMGETWSGGVVFFNAATGSRNYTYHLHQLVESGLALGSANTNTALETYVLNDSDGVVCFDKSKPHGFHGNGNLHKQFGKNQRLMSGAYQQGVDVYTADLDGDGLSEVLVPTTRLNPLWQPNETILDDDGAILWREWKQPVAFPLNQWLNNACMIPLNPDRDNRVDVLSFAHAHEIVFRSWNGIELVNRPGWPKSFSPFLPSPPVVGDVDGDGQEEILIGTYDPTGANANGNLFVFALDGTLEHTIPVPGGLKHIPSIANVFGTGLAVVYRSLAGRVYIRSFGSTSSGPVSWSTHRGNQQRDGKFNVMLYPAGTPIITDRASGLGWVQFSWTVPPASAPGSWRIYRAGDPEGPFEHLVTLTAESRTFTDTQLQPGSQYFYEVAAVYGTGTVRSAPFPMLAGLSGNLVKNGGFEENSDSHWDKWFTGDIHWTNMSAVTAPHRGNKSMRVTLASSGSGGSISQNGQYGTPDSYIPVTPGTLYSFGGFFRSSGLTHPTEHWLEWSSTVTGENTNARPSRPYPSYFTPRFKPGTTSGEWTYANRTFVMPTGFPNVEITHWFSTDIPASGEVYLDDVFFRALPSPNATNWTQLIPFGSAWRYSTTTVADWFTETFSDIAWPLGNAKFGAGSGPLGILTPLPPNNPAYYFRRNFVVPPHLCEELLLSATCTDEGLPLEIWLNGTKLPTTGIEATTGQGNTVQHFDLAPFLHLLRAGVNTIAVQLNNRFSGWDDVAFDISLKTIMRATRPMSLNVQRGVPTNPGAAASITGDAQIGLNITIPPNTVWRVESADALPGPWQLVDIVSNTGSETIYLPDLGQNGRVPPEGTAARFYRLRPN